MLNFFTSDTHFGHKNVVEYCDRPYRKADGQIDVDAMNESLVANWNARVGPDDKIYHLGDFAMGQRQFTLPLGKRLNGYKILISGNHDETDKKMKEVAGFHEVYSSLIIEEDGHKILLRHEPMLNYKATYPEVDFHLCGHVHKLWKFDAEHNITNVGVDQWDYKPVTLPEILGSLQGKQ